MLETTNIQSHTKLTMLRNAFSFNKKEFSLILETPYRTYQMWERLNRNISLKATKILLSFGVNPSYINGDDKLLLDNYNFEEVKDKMINKLIEMRTK